MLTIIWVTLSFALAAVFGAKAILSKDNAPVDGLLGGYVLFTLLLVFLASDFTLVPLVAWLNEALPEKGKPARYLTLLVLSVATFSALFAAPALVGVGIAKAMRRLKRADSVPASKH